MKRKWHRYTGHVRIPFDPEIVRVLKKKLLPAHLGCICMHFSKENNHAERWTHDNLYLVLKLDESTRARVKTAALGVYSRGQFLRMFACFALPTNS